VSAGERFPRQHARTRRFTLGAPRSFTVAPDGRRVAFLRSAAGDDPVTRLWCLDLPDGAQRCVLDPTDIAADAELPIEERARRERVREQAGGIVAYATDRAVTLAVAAVGTGVAIVDLLGGTVAHHDLGLAPVDPRLSPAGDHVAYVADRALHLFSPATGSSHRLVGEDEPERADAVAWGLPDFIAAEEMRRTRGYWWAPDGRRLAVARVDEGAVARWHIADPANPDRAPRVVRYPAAGTANADVTLAVVDLDGTRVDVDWDRLALPYLVSVTWQPDTPLTIAVQSRDQRTLQIRAVDDPSGATTVVHEAVDPHWVEIVVGVPRWSRGRLVHAMDVESTRRLAVGGSPVTPASLHVRAVHHVGDDDALVTASTDDPTTVGVWRVALDGSGAEPLTGPGVHDVTAAGDVRVLTSATLDGPPTATVQHPAGTAVIDSYAEEPVVRPAPALLRLGDRALCSALLLPTGRDPDAGPLPVLLDPYGGPHAQRVLRARDAFTTPQWFADQGFAVLVTDGRGSPGRGTDWERTLAGDLGSAPLEDQVDALHAAAEAHPGVLDLDRVTIRGWSFGGYLAALAVLRRPEVFRAAIAGAPVTDWRLYDTHYTERYLGQPDAGAYERSSLLDEAAALQRPLLLIHGLADDNVVAAHTLRLSAALLAAGRPHEVLPLSGVTHMTPQEVVAENLLLLQLAFLRRWVAERPGGDAQGHAGVPAAEPSRPRIREVR
jgi:dipeptidyl-peptidase 4